MSQDLEQSVVDQIEARQARPVILVEYDLDVAGTLRFCAAKNNVVFPTGGNTYTARAVVVDRWSVGRENQIGRISLRIDNVAGEWSSYAQAEAFAGAGLVIKKVYRDALSNSAYYREIFRGELERPRLDRHWCYQTAVQGRRLGSQFLREVFQEACPHRFGEGQCNQDGLADLTSLTASGEADSGNASTLTDSALTQAADFWNHGEISVTISGKTYYRRVHDFDAATDTVTFDVPLPVSVSNGDAYTVYKGCDKTFDTCQGDNAWGPSADNSLNFGGFLHINRVSSRPDKVPASVDGNIDIGEIVIGNV